MSERWKNVRPAWILAAAILIGWLFGEFGYGVTLCAHNIPNSCIPHGSDYLAQNNALVIYYHQYYQLFSSMLITSGASGAQDAAFNAIAVLVLDFITEDNLNKTRYFIVFVSSALVGNLLTLLQGPYYSSAGASGGIFGIYAALITFSYLRSRKLDAPPFILFVVIFVGSSLLGGVNYVAHIGGAIGGFIVGALIYESVKSSITEYSMAHDSRRSTVLVTSMILILIVVASSIQFFYFVS